MVKKIRLTREQSREQTRQHLLDAAQTLFLRKGFASTSVEDISLAAGYTRGAFYSNFRSKTEILLLLLRRNHEAIMADMLSVYEGEATRAQMEARVQAFYRTIYRKNDCFLLWMDAKLHAVRDARFRTVFISFLREMRQAITDSIRQFSERVGTPLPLPPEQLTLGLLALCDGMKFDHALDPQEVSAEVTETVLGGFFQRVVFGQES